MGSAAVSLAAPPSRGDVNLATAAALRAWGNLRQNKWLRLLNMCARYIKEASGQAAWDGRERGG